MRVLLGADNILKNLEKVYRSRVPLISLAQFGLCSFFLFVFSDVLSLRLTGKCLKDINGLAYGFPRCA